jgi:selenocysteine-specific elongation factor
MPHVVATAGHVDHGKSTLIQALTGIDPDRLAEEKARGLTIDLGFAWATLPSGREIGFVDVPGHERFVHNMLAGVGGVDCALLVVDVTEGWMPQSAEHLAILDLLGLRSGVVALTKCDLMADLGGDRDAVTERIADELRGTSLEGIEVVPTAARTGAGLDELAAALDRALDAAGEPPDRGRPRLPVDRVFSVRGAGTVVTGTLAGGTVAAGTELELFGAGPPRRVRVRGLQAHERPVETAAPVARVAANLAGVAVESVTRGDVLVTPGRWRPTTMADARIRCLAAAPGPLRAKGAWLLYAGTAESAVRLQLLDASEIKPGGTALVRLHLERPLVLDVFEPVVLRDSGRDETAGGGPVLDPHPPVPVRGTAARVTRIEQLEAREQAGRAGILERVLAERGPLDLGDLPWLAADGLESTAAALLALTNAGAAVRTRATLWPTAAWEAARHAVLEAVAAHHVAEPLAPGMPAAAAAAAGGRAEVVEALLAEQALFAEAGVVRLPGHGVQLDPRQQEALRAVEEHLAGAGVTALTEQELAALGADRRLVAACERLGVLTRIGPGAWLGTEALAGAVATLKEGFADGTAFTAGEARDALATTRKTAIPLLEHLDRTGVTARDGDVRRLR